MALEIVDFNLETGGGKLDTEEVLAETSLFVTLLKAWVQKSQAAWIP